MHEELLERLADLNPEALTPDGFDEALVGIAETPQHDHVGLYCRNLCLHILVKQMGLESLEEAREYFEFNVAGFYVGDNGPIYADFPDDTFFLPFAANQPVVVKDLKYIGFGIVKASFPSHQSQPGFVDVGLENGNTWSYHWTGITKVPRSKDEAMLKKIAKAHKLKWSSILR